MMGHKDHEDMTIATAMLRGLRGGHRPDRIRRSVRSWCWFCVRWSMSLFGRSRAWSWAWDREFDSLVADIWPMLIPGGLQVTLSPEQEPEVWLDPVDGVVLDLDDDLRVFTTAAQAIQIRDAIDRMIDKMQGDDDPDPPECQLGEDGAQYGVQGGHAR